MDETGLDLDALGITDDLMFGTVFQDEELCRRLVETLLGIEVESIKLAERQGHLGVGPLARAGVVDLLVREASGDTYDVEMQNEPGADIAQRARYYLSLVNATMLDPGQEFGELHGAVVVFVCAHDPFGRGWKRYNFPRLCKQDGEPLGDGSEIVFVNAEGTRGDVGQELDAFIRYLHDDTMIGSDYVRCVDDAVRAWRENPLWRRYRMLWSEKYRDDFASARAKGREEGLAKGQEEGVAKGRREGLAQGRECLSLLADRLEADGRADELVPALHDPDRLVSLMREFHIEV